MIKKILFWLFVVIVIIVVSLLSFRFFSQEDNWLCDNGQWVKHGNPSAPMPTSGCGAVSGTTTKPTVNVNDTYGNSKNQTKLTSPSANQLITSPFKVRGTMPSSWYFEANAVLKLFDSNGNLIVFSPVRAIGEWMQANTVIPFEAELQFDTPSTPTGYLVLMNDNPSGLPENEKSEVYNVRFWQIVKVYYNKKETQVCEDVVAVNRYVKPTTAVGRAALEELLKGPSESEKADGFVTLIPEGVKIQSLTIEKGVAKVDFNQVLQEAVGGSCRVYGIRAQIIETLKQFSTVRNVIISIDGKTGDILQP